MASPVRVTPLRSGRNWEQVAESFLQRRGLTTLSRNFRGRCGELDLVMEHASELVFVEVRYRERKSHGSGAETIDRRKQRRIEMTAALFLARHPGYATRVCRFDVISIRREGGKPEIDWIRNAFDAQQG